MWTASKILPLHYVSDLEYKSLIYKQDCFSFPRVMLLKIDRFNDIWEIWGMWIKMTQYFCIICDHHGKKKFFGYCTCNLKQNEA